ncbi:hypothetical protein D3C80_2008530 [compost metagenome]
MRAIDTQPLAKPRSNGCLPSRITVRARAINTPKIIDNAAVSKVTQAPLNMSGRARRAERHWKV